ncbi:MAG TPA: YceD family protein [Steroidobacteraceae bacterium]|nr:YceD family protein [Steroidobacteraceae bacterium]
MASGLREIVDCERLAREGARLERVYALADLPRLQDLLAEPQGTLRATFAFARTESGRAGVTVEIEAAAQLVCQRCLSMMPYTVAARSEIEFAAADAADASSGGREPYALTDGSAALVELAEEEFLLAAPLAPSCSAPGRCGRAPQLGADGPAGPETVRPFGALRDLLQKTDRT